MKVIKRLPESELEIMQIIWKEPAPVSRILIEERLQQEHPLAPTTILTLLTRLILNGNFTMWGDVVVFPNNGTNYYYPVITEKEYLASESRSFLDRLFQGSVANFAAALNDGGVKKEELEELRQLLEKGEL